MSSSKYERSNLATTYTTCLLSTPPLARAVYQSRQIHLPGHTSPDWYRCILATIHLALPSCCHLPWGHPWTGSWEWGLQGPRLTSFSLYFCPVCPLRPCLLLHPRFGAVRSDHLHSWPDIHRVPAASLRTLERPFCAGQPCVSPHSILGTCSSGGVCACWLAHTTRCSLTVSHCCCCWYCCCCCCCCGRRFRSNTAHNAARLREQQCWWKAQKSQESRCLLSPVILRFVPPNPEKEVRRYQPGKKKYKKDYSLPPFNVKKCERERWKYCIWSLNQRPAPMMELSSWLSCFTVMSK